MKKYLAVCAAVITTSVLAACGASSDSATDHSGHGASQSATAGTNQNTDQNAEHNAQDVMFAQMMIPHHQQAIEMADMVTARTDVTPELTALATQIRDAQQPEIDTMTGWLTAWGEDVPTADSGMGDHGGHGGMGGMMSDEQMSALAAATGAEFEKMWLEMMIDHHLGAIDMAKAQQTAGQFPDAIAMADAIVSSQQAEIDTMKQMLAG